MTRRLAFFLLSLTLLSSCGFHLRGNITLPDSLSDLHVSGEDLDLVIQLASSLEDNGAIIYDEPDGVAHIDIEYSEFERELRTTEASGLASSYTLYYDVIYSVYDSDGEPLSLSQDVEQVRTLQYSAEEELQAEEEEEFLEEAMRDELILIIMSKLSRLGA